MDCVRITSCALLVSAVALISGGANAQGRGPSAAELRAKVPQVADTPEARARKEAELADWLGRLVGRFRIQGSITNTLEDPCEANKRKYPNVRCRNLPPPPPLSVRGLGDCAGFGTGPGVHCVFNASWDDPPPPPTLQVLREPWLFPGMMLFGVDPARQEIRYLEVNSWSIAEAGERGVLEGDAVTFHYDTFPYSRRTRETTRCARCRSMRITASPDRQIIRMTIRVLVFDIFDVTYDFELKRLPEGWTGGPSVAPPVR